MATAGMIELIAKQKVDDRLYAEDADKENGQYIGLSATPNENTIYELIRVPIQFNEHSENRPKYLVRFYSGIAGKICENPDAYKQYVNDDFPLETEYRDNNNPQNNIVLDINNIYVYFDAQNNKWEADFGHKPHISVFSRDRFLNAEYNTDAQAPLFQDMKKLVNPLWEKFQGYIWDLPLRIDDVHISNENSPVYKLIKEFVNKPEKEKDLKYFINALGAYEKDNRYVEVIKKYYDMTPEDYYGKYFDHSPESNHELYQACIDCKLKMNVMDRDCKSWGIDYQALKDYVRKGLGLQQDTQEDTNKHDKEKVMPETPEVAEVLYVTSLDADGLAAATPRRNDDSYFVLNLFQENPINYEVKPIDTQVLKKPQVYDKSIPENTQYLYFDYKPGFVNSVNGFLHLSRALETTFYQKAQDIPDDVIFVYDEEGRQRNVAKIKEEEFENKLREIIAAIDEVAEQVGVIEQDSGFDEVIIESLGKLFTQSAEYKLYLENKDKDDKELTPEVKRDLRTKYKDGFEDVEDTIKSVKGLLKNYEKTSEVQTNNPESIPVVELGESLVGAKVLYVTSLEAPGLKDAKDKQYDGANFWLQLTSDQKSYSVYPIVKKVWENPGVYYKNVPEITQYLYFTYDEGIVNIEAGNELVLAEEPQVTFYVNAKDIPDNVFVVYDKEGKEYSGSEITKLKEAEAGQPESTPVPAPAEISIEDLPESFMVSSLSNETLKLPKKGEEFLVSNSLFVLTLDKTKHVYMVRPILNKVLQIPQTYNKDVSEDAQFSCFEYSSGTVKIEAGNKLVLDEEPQVRFYATVNDIPDDCRIVYDADGNSYDENEIKQLKETTKADEGEFVYKEESSLGEQPDSPSDTDLSASVSEPKPEPVDLPKKLYTSGHSSELNTKNVKDLSQEPTKETKYELTLRRIDGTLEVYYEVSLYPPYILKLLNNPSLWNDKYGKKHVDYIGIGEPKMNVDDSGKLCYRSGSFDQVVAVFGNGPDDVKPGRYRVLSREEVKAKIRELKQIKKENNMSGKEAAHMLVWNALKECREFFYNDKYGKWIGPILIVILMGLAFGIGRGTAPTKPNNDSEIEAMRARLHAIMLEHQQMQQDYENYTSNLAEKDSTIRVRDLRIEDLEKRLAKKETEELRKATEELNRRNSQQVNNGSGGNSQTTTKKGNNGNSSSEIPVGRDGKPLIRLVEGR